MAHTIGKFQYLIIERTFLEGKQIDEYFELADSEKIAVAIANEWERAYGAKQTASNTLRAEFDTGFGTTEVRELTLLSVPVVTEVSGVGSRALRSGYVYILEHTIYEDGVSSEEWMAFNRIGDAEIELRKIIRSYERKGNEIIRDSRYDNNINVISKEQNLEAHLLLRKVTAYRHDRRFSLV